MTTGRRIEGIVLAAGAGRRMGMPKAEVVLDGRRLLDRAVDVLREAGCRRVVAVVRTGVVVELAEAVVNPDPDRGMRSSLEVGLSTVPHADAVAVVLVDTPGMTAAGAAAVLDAWRPGRVAVARHGTRRAHPTVMSPELWNHALLVAGPDEGARTFLRAHPDLVDEVDAPGSADDLDTAADLERWAAGGR